MVAVMVEVVVALVIVHNVPIVNGWATLKTGVILCMAS